MRLRNERRWARWTSFTTTLFCLAQLAGCGGSAASNYVPVEGQVKYGGKALTKGVVIYHADAAKGNDSKHEARATIEADGSYKLISHPHPGAPPGWYKVTVSVTEPSDPKNPYSTPRLVIPEKFARPE